MTKRAPAQQLAIKTNLLTDFLIERYEAHSSVRKSELSDKLTALFYAHDGAQHAQLSENLRNEKKKAADTNRTLAKLEKLHGDVEKLDKNEVIAWSSTRGITIPEDVTIDTVKTYVLSFYQEKINKTKADVTRINTSVEQLSKLSADVNKQCSEFKKTYKKEYGAWKIAETNANNEKLKALKKVKDSLPANHDSTEVDVINQEIKKREDTFTYLNSVLQEISDKLSQLQRDNYSLRLSRDSLSHNMTRFANADKHLAYYSHQIADHFLSNVFEVYRQRLGNFSLTTSSATLEQLGVQHVSLNEFAASEVRDLYGGILLNLLSTSLIPLTPEERKSKIFSAIETYVKRRIKENKHTAVGLIIKSSGYNPDLVTLLYRVIIEFNKRISELIALKVEQQNIRTFQEKIIADIFRTTYKLWGKTPYEIPKKTNKKN